MGGELNRVFQGTQGSAGQGHLQQKWGLIDRPPALEDLHAQTWVATGQQGQPKRGWRGLVLNAQGAKDKHRTAAATGCELKATHRLWPGGLLQPGQQGTHTIGFQALLHRPEPVGCLGCADDEELLRGQAQGGQGRPIRQLWGGEHQDATATLAEPAKGRGQEAELAQARGTRQELGDTAHGPAAARQLGVEFGMSTGDRGAQPACNGC